jgi:hypothetical protein
MQNLQTLVCPHRIVHLALHWHSVVMQLNEVDRDSSMLQVHIVLIHAQAHDVRTHAHTHTYTHMHMRTHLHMRTHAQTHMHMRTHAHTNIHTRTHNLFL